MKKIFILLVILLCLAAQIVSAQSYAFGLKAGLCIGNQRWTGFGNRSLLYKPCGILFIETADEGNKFALFAQSGFHQKGSALRYFGGSFNNPATGKLETYEGSRTEYVFNNLTLALGGKQKFDWNGYKLYYLLGIRGDYTLKTNLPPSTNLQNFYTYTPKSDYVNRFNYGMTVGGGTEFKISEYISGLLELSVNPDFSRQYYDPPYPNRRIFDPSTGQFVIGTLPEQSIRNLTFEITLGIKFLRKIEYID